MAFAEFDKTNRTDADFRNRRDPDHHKEEKSPLEDLMKDGKPTVDMVRDFPTSDPLHLLEGGVMKRLLLCWLNGSTEYLMKFTQLQKNEATKLILFCNTQLSCDINRKVRPIDHMKYYKATEFRTILLYTGMVVFKDLLEPEVYTHFIRFCLAVRLCSCQTYVQNKKMRDLAKNLFSEFCAGFIIIYGKDSIVSNIHLVSHIIEDVERFGSLNDISTYPFENYLREIKSKVTASKQPVEQIARRIAEVSLDWNDQIGIIDPKTKHSNWLPVLKYEFKCKLYKNLTFATYQSIQITPNVYLSTKKPGDKWFLTVTNDIFEMKFATQIDSSYFVSGAKIENKGNFFVLPYSSIRTDIYISDGNRRSGNKLINISDIKAKMMCIFYNKDLVFIPILHSIDECLEFLKTQ